MFICCNFVAAAKLTNAAFAELLAGCCQVRPDDIQEPSRLANSQVRTKHTDEMGHVVDDFRKVTDLNGNNGGLNTEEAP